MCTGLTICMKKQYNKLEFREREIGVKYAKNMNL